MTIVSTAERQVVPSKLLLFIKQIAEPIAAKQTLPRHRDTFPRPASSANLKRHAYLPYDGLYLITGLLIEHSWCGVGCRSELGDHAEPVSSLGSCLLQSTHRTLAIRQTTVIQYLSRVFV